MSNHPRWRGLLVLALIVAVLVTIVAVNDGPDAVSADPLADVPVGGTVQMENACYARLPDIPAPRYGGFGAYNPDTGVLAYVGGAKKFGAENAYTHFQMYAIQLDGSMDAWNTINYPANVGFARAPNRGCSEMSSVQLPGGSWASVGGKGGCDGDVSRKGGDIKELVVGADATGASVRWVPGSGTDPGALPSVLRDGKFQLARNFAIYDATRDRLVFGQGTFNYERNALTRHEIYQAVNRGSGWVVTQLFPAGANPGRRFSTCAAYLYDEATGVDGVFVFGGQQGGTTGTTSYKEVWWLDFSEGAHGTWSNITDRFTNMDTIGYRRGGACAFDADTKAFYSWMGRADASIPDGAKQSAGSWRVDLTNLGDDAATFAWERLAKDEQADVTGRQLVPSLYDDANNRFLAIGGLNDLDALRDVWAIYPDVTGAACANLDAYEPFRNPPTPTPVPAPTLTPVPPNPEVCALAKSRAPAQVVADALANPASVAGYQQLCNPNVPESRANPKRSWLSISRADQRYHPMFNALEWKCGCP